MESENYPFKLVNAFFINLQLKRGPNIPDSIHLNIPVEIKVNAPDYPERFQVGLRMHVESGEPPITLEAELVGIYELAEANAKPENGILKQFIEQRAVFTLWAYMSQMIQIASGQMGMNPLKIENPYKISVPEIAFPDSADKG